MEAGVKFDGSQVVYYDFLHHFSSKGQVGLSPGSHVHSLVAGQQPFDSSALGFPFVSKQPGST